MGLLLLDCASCGRKQAGECLAGFNDCFGCGMMDHKIRHCPLIVKNEGDSLRRCHFVEHPLNVTSVIILFEV